MPRLLVVLSSLVVLAAGCGAPAAGRASGGSDLRIVAAVYPLAWLAGELAPGAEIVSLAAGGQDLHDLELSPRERQALIEAGVVAYLGDLGFQPQVEEALGEATGEVVDVSEVVGSDALLPIDEAGAHDDEQASASDRDDHGGVDPHMWFDAGLVAQVATSLGDALATADPGNAGRYRAEAERVADELTALDREIAGLLTDCRFDEIIVSHEAYAYLLAPHGLSQHGISAAAGHAAASPRRVAELAAEIRDEGIPAVLTEPVEGRTDAEAVAREADVDLIDIYSLDIVDDDQAARGYPTLLREQAQAVARAAQCA